MDEPKPELIGYKGKPIEKGSETIYELVRAEDGFGYGLALVRITNEVNEKHSHREMQELYVVVWGGLAINYGPILFPAKVNWSSLSAGESKTIPSNYWHQAHAAGTSHAWFYVFTWPPFDPSDYHRIED